MPPERRGSQEHRRIAWRVRWLRLERGWTQRQLGERLGWTERRISDIERMGSGSRPCSLHVVDAARLARVLGVTLDNLTAPCGTCGGEPATGMTCRACGMDGPEPGTGP